MKRKAYIQNWDHGVLSAWAVWVSYLSQGVAPVAGLLVRVLLVDDVSAGGHRAVEQRLLHILLFGGQQVAQDGHQLGVLDQRHVAVCAELQVALEMEREICVILFLSLSLSPTRSASDVMKH